MSLGRPRFSTDPRPVGVVATAQKLREKTARHCLEPPVFHRSSTGHREASVESSHRWLLHCVSSRHPAPRQLMSRRRFGAAGGPSRQTHASRAWDFEADFGPIETSRQNVGNSFPSAPPTSGPGLICANEDQSAPALRAPAGGRGSGRPELDSTAGGDAPPLPKDGFEVAPAGSGSPSPNWQNEYNYLDLLFFFSRLRCREARFATRRPDAGRRLRTASATPPVIGHDSGRQERNSSSVTDSSEINRGRRASL